MRYSFVLFILIVWFVAGVPVSIGQDVTKKCKTSIKGGTYRRASISANPRKPGQVGGNVLISPNIGEISYFVDLAKRLKQEYCKADAIIVVVFDSKEKMNNGWEIYNRDETRVRWRAVYRYSKTDNIESIEIFDGSGDPRSKKIIDLSAPTE